MPPPRTLQLLEICGGPSHYVAVVQLGWNREPQYFSARLLQAFRVWHPVTKGVPHGRSGNSVRHGDDGTE
jgi:hypothetical protein